MSRTRLGNGFVAILRKLGVKIDRTVEKQIEDEREQNPESTTADIVQRLSLAPPEIIEKAVEIAKESDSPELLADYLREAKAAVRETLNSSAALSDAAMHIARKG
jgi:hypothetical protein